MYDKEKNILNILCSEFGYAIEWFGNGGVIMGNFKEEKELGFIKVLRCLDFKPGVYPSSKGVLITLG